MKPVNRRDRAPVILAVFAAPSTAQQARALAFCLAIRRVMIREQQQPGDTGAPDRWARKRHAGRVRGIDKE